MNTHEDLSRKHDVKGGSDRSFGVVFTILFALLAFWPRVHGRPIRLGWAIAAGAVLAITLGRAALLAPFNRAWTKLAVLLNRIVSPIVSALIFYVVFTPVAMILRWSGKDPLRLRLDGKAETYWIKREPPGPDPATMIHQF